MRTAIGVDVGGTAIKFGLVGEDGKLSRRWELPTDTRDAGSHVIAQIADSVLRAVGGAGEVAGIGLAVPGPVEESGVVNNCLNLGWGRTDAGEELRQRTSLPVVTGNDANMAAWGEMWQGAARDADTFVMLTLGTGVGGGIVIHRRPLAGREGYAGEVGHILVNPDEKRPCVCGNRGCLEQYGSARGLELAAMEYLDTHPNDATLLKRERCTARDVMDAARAGDAAALSLVDRLCDMLGRGTGILSAVISPDLFVIGGGLAKSGAFLLDRIRAAYRLYAFHKSRETPFVLAALGSDAAVYGCARAVLHPGA